MTLQDALAILGLGASANQADLKTAYRRLAAKCHPDLHPHNPQATQQFQRINAANKLLKAKLPPAPAKPAFQAQPLKASPQQVRAQRGYATVRDFAPKGQIIDVYC